MIDGCRHGALQFREEHDVVWLIVDQGYPHGTKERVSAMRVNLILHREV